MKKLSEFDTLNPGIVYIDGQFINMHTVDTVEWIQESNRINVVFISGEVKTIGCIDENHAYMVLEVLQEAHDIAMSTICH